MTSVSRFFSLPLPCAAVVAAWAFLLIAAAGATAVEPLPTASPEQVGISCDELSRIDAIVAEGISEKKMPGCVVAIGRHGKLAYLKAFGNRQVEPKPLPMTTDTVFDLASLTKAIATTTSVMILVERHAVALDEPVARYLPEFGGHGKDRITVAQLVTHQGGLVPDNDLADYLDGPEKAWQRICALKPSAKPGEKFMYSDVGFIVLGKLVERVSGKTLDRFAHDEIFLPLGMNETGYRPDASLRGRAAPTAKRGDGWIRGEVHDPRCYELGGVAGHAGVFSTVRDVAIFAQTLLDGGKRGNRRILAPETVALMTSPRDVPGGGLRSLGWDVRSSFSKNRGTSFSPRAFGHSGFTGTSIWIDPELDLFVIVLSNRLHPQSNGSVTSLAGQIGTVAGQAIVDRTTPPEHGNRRVLAGIDVLEHDNFRALQGRRIGLITNHTGVDGRGVSTARLLQEAPGVKLVALFSPEHGFHGVLDRENIGDARDEATGVAVYSLYGKTKRPTAEMLRGLDTLVFDIQDVGARFYTYISTMGYAMQAAAKRNLRFVVLDRPNPIGGCAVAGPILDPGRESFVAFHRLPIRHGMTVGELARLFNDELQLNLDLEVIPVEGWHRADDYDATGLRWINPSPNMRNLTEAFFYPGVGLLEMTNLSVGRGADTPFEVIGAPWIDADRLAEKLNQLGLDGVRFEPAAFTPVASKYQDESCRGVRIVLTDRKKFEPVRTGLAIALELRRSYPNQWDTSSLDVLLGSKAICKAIRACRNLDEIESDWQADLESFKTRRAKHLLYE